MSVLLVTMGSVITHFFCSPLQHEQSAPGPAIMDVTSKATTHGWAKQGRLGDAEPLGG
jgi:hypothetical protein